MDKTKEEKYNDLLRSIKKLGSVAIAFSGGVDSTFLLKAAAEALGDKVIAFTIKTPYIPRWEVEEASELTKDLGVKHIIIDMPLHESIKNNPNDRCYLCKKMLFSRLLEEAKKAGVAYVIEGTNADDTSDYRPGLRALKELQVVSPILQAGITKEEIRELSKRMGLPTWDKPAYACLLTRIPYDTKITYEMLEKIERGEKFLAAEGYRGTRVRVHDKIVRIETRPEWFGKMMEEEQKKRIIKEFKEIGFTFVTLDMEGYRTGCFNPGKE
ncbi:MAG: ATP-dependent sacrificial sulfur transferase LarE [Bacteroidales bacterium]|nr:ATP-dependent sacrificial sulfur transferase LarE [Bacteroidales bacterium]